ncbi:spore germination protein [Paenibacillus illinoisensis]|uniref:GerA spore germination protein n=1 Tax=Paenibacillus illinoisensis TaxID=59845 RepID=A0A2W0CEN8_9BACL|nr:spore germination protein [Paenibacillus illinoisensis]PYY31443.1 GerA spore germination protein [Paenibacillus illinoisensis]
MEHQAIDTTSHETLLASLKEQFNPCADVVIQTFPAKDETDMSVIMLYCDGLVDGKQLNQFIIPRLEDHTLLEENFHPKELGLTLNPIEDLRDTENINLLIFSGQLLLIFGNQSCSLDIASIPGRNPEESAIESSVKGPRDGFTEELSVNMALIRKRMKTSSMCFEKYVKGGRTQTAIGLLYVKDIINPEILKEARQNLDKIEIDGILGTSVMERSIMGGIRSIFPLTDNTERPDYVVSSLLNGRFAVLIEGSPVAIIAPTTLFNQLKSPEDESTPFFIVTFERILRISGLLIACFFPAFYIGLTSFNVEQIPLPLLATIAGTRMGLPLPVTLEAFLMIFMFELFNEAGRRLPRALGQTVSVVGGLIIGDAAIRAGITSPTIIVSVAISVISSYILVNTVLSGATAQVRIGMLVISSLLGLFGFMLGLFAVLVHLVSLECYGVSYLSPVSPYIPGDFTQSVSMKPSMKRTKRPAALHTQDSTRRRKQP